MDLISMITKQLSDPEVLGELSKNTGAQPNQAQQLAKTALPVILGALQNNATTPEGAKSLDKALEAHKDDKVDDLLGFLQNIDTNDGAKMLQHIFSGKKEDVENELAQKAGLDKNQVTSLLVQLAPLVIGMLGNEKKKTKKT